MIESQKTQVAPDDDELDLRELFHILWAGKWLIVSITFAAAVIAVILALRQPDIYHAEALLAPNDRENAGLSAMATQYGGLASLAGINLRSGGTDNMALGLAILESRKFISEFIERHDILVSLMAAKGWDPETDKLEIDSSNYDIAAKKWIRPVSSTRKAIPSSQEAYEKFSRLLSVDQNSKTGFVSLAVEHYSPVVAKQWVDWLIDDLNMSIMRQDVAEAEQAIEYLNEQIESTSLADLQIVFFDLIEEQTKIVMLAKVTDEYFLKTLDPAVVPEMKSKPRRSLMVIFSTFFGFLVAVAVVLGMSSLRRQRN